MAELYHHGVKGMRWGVRRYQNKDGSLTPAGKKRQANAEQIDEKKTQRKKTAKERTAKAIVKGADIAAKLMVANALDDALVGGAGKRVARKAVVKTGRAAVTAYTMARGGYDIKWYDKHGRRVG